jgi:hypothetical protein
MPVIPALERLRRIMNLRPAGRHSETLSQQSNENKDPGTKRPRRAHGKLILLK